MPIRMTSGNLLVDDHGATAIAHGCNCRGSMGAGIARGIRALYPEMYEEYRALCKAEPRQFDLGDCRLWRSDALPWVFNLGTQERHWRCRATCEAVEASLRSMCDQADREWVGSIATPRVGAGLGGPSWRKVRAIVEAVFGDWAGPLVVFEELAPAPPPADDPATGGGAIIRFYRVGERYGEFSDFWPHPIELGGKTWPTSEHDFQAMKFVGTPDEEEVRLARSPTVAARMGRSRARPLREDWGRVKDDAMLAAVRAEFARHDRLKGILRSTGDAAIVEHTAKGAYRGDGGDGSGRNRLEQVRSEIVAADG